MILIDKEKNGDKPKMLRRELFYIISRNIHTTPKFVPPTQGLTFNDKYSALFDCISGLYLMLLCVGGLSSHEHSCKLVQDCEQCP